MAVSALAIALFLAPGGVEAQDRAADARSQQGNDRIVGGRPVETSAEGAWAVVLELDNQFHCGGSLVAPEATSSTRRFVTWHAGQESPRWVITAAHCLYDHQGQRATAERLTVLTGSLDRFNDDEGGERLQVRYLMEHEGYDSRTTSNDIALLYLQQPNNVIDARRRASIGLPDGDEIDWAYAPYTQVHAQGWGATSFETGQTNKFLFEVRVPIVDQATCGSSYLARGRELTPGMICAGYARGQYDSCRGDSGGPLVFRPARNASSENTFLAGVVSWGIGCALPNLAGVYASTTYFRPWLEEAFLRCDVDPSEANCSRRALPRVVAFERSAFTNMISGEIDLRPDGCEGVGLCRLGSPLRFVQSDGTAWQTDIWTSDAVQSGTTDGASIPLWAQPIIGVPFDRSYLKAAILHDHYTYRENHVRGWRSTHRMFRDALLASGISRSKAHTMFYAVLVGGPRWDRIVQGEPCPGDCVKTIGPVGEGQGDGWEDDLYDAPGFAEAVQRFHERDANVLFDEDELERQAKAERERLMAQ